MKSEGAFTIPIHHAIAFILVFIALVVIVVFAATRTLNSRLPTQVEIVRLGAFEADRARCTGEVSVHPAGVVLPYGVALQGGVMRRKANGERFWLVMTPIESSELQKACTAAGWAFENLQ